MYFNGDNTVLLVFQALCLALPAAGVPLWLHRFRGSWWALVLPLSIIVVVVGIAEIPETADALTWIALIGVPIGAALAFGWAAHGARGLARPVGGAAPRARMGRPRRPGRPARHHDARRRLGGGARAAPRRSRSASAAEGGDLRAGGGRCLPRLLGRASSPRTRCWSRPLRGPTCPSSNRRATARSRSATATSSPRLWSARSSPPSAARSSGRRSPSSRSRSPGTSCSWSTTRCPRRSPRRWCCWESNCWTLASARGVRPRKRAA